MNRPQVLYKVLENFDVTRLYEATDLAEWFGVPEKHRLMRYYLNRLVRDGILVKVVWGHRTFYGLKVLEPVFEVFSELFDWRMARVYKVRR